MNPPKADLLVLRDTSRNSPLAVFSAETLSTSPSAQRKTVGLSVQNNGTKVIIAIKATISLKDVFQDPLDADGGFVENIYDIDLKEVRWTRLHLEPKKTYESVMPVEIPDEAVYVYLQIQEIVFDDLEILEL